MSILLWGIPLLSLTIWVGLLLWRGQFWRCHQRFSAEIQAQPLSVLPSVCAIIPARNEEAVIETSLRSLFSQDYSGLFSLILVNDQSCDRTADIAQATNTATSSPHSLEIVSGKPLPQGWSGKLWAVNQGLEIAQQSSSPPDYFLLTDADIAHHPHTVTQLVQKAETENLAMVSAMVQLQCETFWEKFLIPAFIFFFQKLYPFAWVNNPQHPLGAAAGGCILIRRDVLTAIGGIASVKDALIDDCSLGQKVKSYLQKHPTLAQGIWLGLEPQTHSLRSYDSLNSLWDLVARTAYTQLNYSPLLLGGTLIGMSLIYLAPPLGVIGGFLIMNPWTIALSLGAWGLMTLSYLPTLRLYSRSWLYSLSLPAIAFLYTLMTLDSALRHWQGQGGKWKGRVYP